MKHPDYYRKQVRLAQLDYDEFKDEGARSSLEFYQKRLRASLIEYFQTWLSEIRIARSIRPETSKISENT